MQGKRGKQVLVLTAALALIASPDAAVRAQLLGPVGQAVGGLTETVGERLNTGLEDAGRLTRPVRQVARLRLRDLLRDNPRALEADERGFPVVRGEIVAISPEDGVLQRARADGFDIARREELEGIGTQVVILKAPEGMSARQALKRLRQSDPHGTYDLNHIYTASGLAGEKGRAHRAPDTGGVARAGLIDGGVADHPALSGLIAEQRGFAPGGVIAGDHGTAVASLLVGRAAEFRGAAPGGRLLVADVYGNGPTGGSAEALARALGWMAVRQVPVINVSLVGPPNLLVRTAVTMIQKRGQIVVAAVGNDGPAAPPLYPASYPGVIAVTGVDGANRVLAEAGRGNHVDFAAPGADMAAARAGGGYARIRGTSYAAPLVAGILAAEEGNAAERIASASRAALDLGKRGSDPVYGKGLLCSKCRNSIKNSK
jgi:hypothetical protein